MEASREIVRFIVREENAVGDESKDPCFRDIPLPFGSETMYHRDMAREVLGFICRWIVALAFFGLAGWAAKTGYDTSRIGLLGAALPLFLVGVAFVWKTLFFLATRPLVVFIESIVFPRHRIEKPPLNLKLPAFYINEGRYTEAMEEYRKILKHYPDEPEAYEKAAWLNREIFDDPEEALRLIRKAERRSLVLDERVVKAVRG